MDKRNLDDNGEEEVLEEEEADAEEEDHEQLHFVRLRPPCRAGLVFGVWGWRFGGLVLGVEF